MLGGGIDVWVEEAFRYLAANPLLAVVVLGLAYKLVSHWMAGPFPEAGGRVRTVHNAREWAAALGDSELVVADFYATWCPPCRAAAPVFGRMSDAFPGVAFLKLDVDGVRDVAQSEGIAAMPTFKIYKNGACVDTIQGFRQDALERALLARGATRGAAPAAAPAETKKES